MYGKIFRQMYKGTLAMVGPWEALVTFQQMIVLADKDGVVDMTSDAISRETTIPLGIITKGIEALEKPDPDSRTPDEEGRRIVRLSDTRQWGWRITNYQHYRKLRSEEERREYHRNYWRTKRSKKQDSTDSTPTQQTQLNSSHAVSSKQYAEGKEEKNAASPLPPSLNLNAWTEWLAYRVERKLPKYRPSSAKKNSAFLADLSAEDQQAVVDYSIRNGYQGLFEPKGNSNGTRQQAPRKLSAVERVHVAGQRWLEEQGKGAEGVGDDDPALRRSVSGSLR